MVIQMKEKNFKLLNFLPLSLFFLFYIILLTNGVKINYVVLILSLCLLLIIALSFNKDKYKRWGFLALLILTVWYLIMGYYDYLKWTSSLIGIIIFSYYLILNYFNNYKK